MGAPEDAGTIYAEVRLALTQMEKDGLDAQKAMDKLAAKFKQQGQTAGKDFAGGMKQGFDNVENSAAKLGRSIATKLSPAILAIGAGIKIFQGIGQAIGNAFMANEKFAKGLANLKADLADGFAQALKPVSDFFAKVMGVSDESVRSAREVREELKKIKTEIADIQSQGNKNRAALDIGVDRGLINEFDAAKQKVQEYTSEINSLVAKQAELKTRRLNSGEREQLANIETIINSTKRERDAIKDYLLPAMELQLEAQSEMKKEILNRTELEYTGSAKLKAAIEANTEGVKGELKIRGDYVASLESEVPVLDDIISRAKYMLTWNKENSELITTQLQNAEKTRAALIGTIDIEKTRLDITKDQAEIKEAMEKAEKKQLQAAQTAMDAQEAGLINEEEMNRQISASLAQKYADLEAITILYGDATGAAKDELEIVKQLRKETAEQVKDEQDKKWLKEIQASQEEEITKQLIAQKQAEAEAAQTEGEKNKLLDEAIKLENDLIGKQRKLAWEAIENSESFKAQSQDVRDKILEDFNTITAGMRKTREGALKTGGGNWLANALGITEKQLDDMMKVGDAAINAFDNISNAALDISRKHAEEQMAGIEKALEETLDSIQKAREKELIAAGFAVENNIKSLEQQLEAAKRIGDEVLIYQLERRVEEQRINDEYDEKARAAEEEAARKKAEIEFKLAKQEHAMKIISAVNAGAMAILQALQSAESPVNFILAGLVGAAAGVQIGMIASNPPKMPKFANSGIVPGNKYFGDRNVAAVDSGELILNRAHQENIANQLTAGSGAVTATVVVMLDGMEIGQNTFALANKGYYTLNTRVIQG